MLRGDEGKAESNGYEENVYVVLCIIYNTLI
jgi:hypothetical protein